MEIDIIGNNTIVQILEIHLTFMLGLDSSLRWNDRSAQCHSSEGWNCAEQSTISNNVY